MSRCLLAYGLVLGMSFSGAAAAESDVASPDDVEQKMVDDERSAAVAAAERNVDTLEAALKQAQKVRDVPKIRDLRSQISAAKKEVGRVRKLSDEWFLAQAKQRLRADAEKAEEAQALKDSGPVVIRRMGINYNVINLPELTLVVENFEDVAVEAYDISAECFNKFDEPVKFPGQSHVFQGTSQTRIAPKTTEKSKWQLSLQGNTTKANVWVSRVKMADGRVITFTKEQAQSKPFGIAKARLME
jgi:hypothetical protein